MSCEYEDTPRCPRVGCLHPHGVCMLSTHRINTDYMQKRVVSIKGRVEELPAQMHEPGLITKLRQFYRNLPFGKPKVKA